MNTFFYRALRGWLRLGSHDECVGWTCDWLLMHTTAKMERILGAEHARLLRQLRKRG